MRRSQFDWSSAISIYTPRTNLIAMLVSVQNQYPNMQLQRSPAIPGLGWIASGVADFSLGAS
jgi:hypothetical protein